MDEIAQILETELQPPQSTHPPSDPSSDNGHLVTQSTPVPVDTCRLSSENPVENPNPIIKVSLPSDSVMCDAVKMETLESNAAAASVTEPSLPLSDTMTYPPTSEEPSSRSPPETVVCSEAMAAKDYPLQSEPVTYSTVSEAAASSAASIAVTPNVLSKADTCQPPCEALTYSAQSDVKTSCVVLESQICSAATSPLIDQLTSNAVTCADSEMPTYPGAVNIAAPLEGPTSLALSATVSYESLVKMSTSLVPSEDLVCHTLPQAINVTDLALVSESSEIEAVPGAVKIEPCTSSDVVDELQPCETAVALDAVLLCGPDVLPSQDLTELPVSETDIAMTAAEHKVYVMSSDFAESLSVASMLVKMEEPSTVVEQQDSDGRGTQVTETFSECVPVKSELVQPWSVIATKRGSDRLSHGVNVSRCRGARRTRSTDDSATTSGQMYKTNIASSKPLPSPIKMQTRRSSLRSSTAAVEEHSSATLGQTPTTNIVSSRLLPSPVKMETRRSSLRSSTATIEEHGNAGLGHGVNVTATVEEHSSATLGQTPTTNIVSSRPPPPPMTVQTRRLSLRSSTAALEEHGSAGLGHGINVTATVEEHSSVTLGQMSTKNIVSSRPPPPPMIVQTRRSSLRLSTSAVEEHGSAGLDRGVSDSTTEERGSTRLGHSISVTTTSEEHSSTGLGSGISRTATADEHGIIRSGHGVSGTTTSEELSSTGLGHGVPAEEHGSARLGHGVNGTAPAEEDSSAGLGHAITCEKHSSTRLGNGVSVTATSEEQSITRLGLHGVSGTSTAEEHCSAGVGYGLSGTATGEEDSTARLHHSIISEEHSYTALGHGVKCEASAEEDSSTGLGHGVKCEAVQLDQLMPFLQRGDFAVIAVISRSSMTSIPTILTAVHNTVSSISGPTASTTSASVVSDSSSAANTMTTVSNTRDSVTSLPQLTTVPNITTSCSSYPTPVSGIVTTCMHNAVILSSSVTTLLSSSLTCVTSAVTSVCSTVTDMSNAVPSTITNVFTVAGSVPAAAVQPMTASHDTPISVTSAVISQPNTTIPAPESCNVTSPTSYVPCTVTCMPDTTAALCSSSLSVMSNTETSPSETEVSDISTSVVQVSASLSNSAEEAPGALASSSTETVLYDVDVSSYCYTGDKIPSFPAHMSDATSCSGSALLIDESMSEDELHIVLQDDSFVEPHADNDHNDSVPVESSHTTSDSRADVVLPKGKSPSVSKTRNSGRQDSVRSGNSILLDSSVKKCPPVSLLDSAAVKSKPTATSASRQLVSVARSSSADLMPRVADILAEMSLFRPVSPIADCQHCSLCDGVSGASRVMVLRKRTITKRKLSEKSDDDEVVPAKISASFSHV